MGIGHEYYLRRWMMFVDGENFTIRAQEFCASHSFALTEGPLFRRDVFLWIGGKGPGDNPRFRNMEYELQPRSVRSSFYTSVIGSPADVLGVRQDLSKLGFDARVFHRPSGSTRSKNVDITLATDVLAHAFQDSYEALVLVAGDADYLPLIDEVKRLGKRVYVLFPEVAGINEQVKLAADVFVSLNDALLQPR